MSLGSSREQPGTDLRENESLLQGELLVQRFIQRIDGVRTQDLRRRAVGLFVEDFGLLLSAEAFEKLLWRASRGDSKARDSWLPVIQWIISLSLERGFPLLQFLRGVAEEAELEGLSAILSEGPARKVLPETARRRERAALDAGAVIFPMELLHGKQWALRSFFQGTVMLDRPRGLSDDGIRFMIPFGQADYRRMVKIYRVMEKIDVCHLGPSMVHRLVGKDWLKLGDLLQMATKRPLNRVVAFEAILSDRWGAHPKVHEALASNPFAPPAVILPLLPLLSRNTLEWLADDERGPSVVGDAARLFVGCSPG